MPHYLARPTVQRSPTPKDGIPKRPDYDFQNRPSVVCFQQSLAVARQRFYVLTFLSRRWQIRCEFGHRRLRWSGVPMYDRRCISMGAGGRVEK